MFFAINPEQLRNLLFNTRVLLKYKKKDGSIKETTGTTNPEIVGLHYEMKKTTKDESKKRNNEIINYFDLEKNEWRSFRFENLMEWEDAD